MEGREEVQGVGLGLGQLERQAVGREVGQACGVRRCRGREG